MRRRPSIIALLCGSHCRRWTTRKVDRKSTRLNSSHSQISYAVFCLKKKDEATVHVLLQDLPGVGDDRVALQRHLAPPVHEPGGVRLLQRPATRNADVCVLRLPGRED